MLIKLFFCSVFTVWIWVKLRCSSSSEPLTGLRRCCCLRNSVHPLSLHGSATVDPPRLDLIRLQTGCSLSLFLCRQKIWEDCHHTCSERCITCLKFNTVKWRSEILMRLYIYICTVHIYITVWVSKIVTQEFIMCSCLSASVYTFVFFDSPFCISAHLYVIEWKCAGVDRLSKDGGEMCEGEWEGSGDVLLCFTITTLSKDGNWWEIHGSPTWCRVSAPIHIHYYIIVTLHCPQRWAGKISTLLCLWLWWQLCMCVCVFFLFSMKWDSYHAF